MCLSYVDGRLLDCRLLYEALNQKLSNDGDVGLDGNKYRAHRHLASQMPEGLRSDKRER